MNQAEIKLLLPSLSNVSGTGFWYAWSEAKDIYNTPNIDELKVKLQPAKSYQNSGIYKVDVPISNETRGNHNLKSIVLFYKDDGGNYQPFAHFAGIVTSDRKLPLAAEYVALYFKANVNVRVLSTNTIDLRGITSLEPLTELNKSYNIPYLFNEIKDYVSLGLPQGMNGTYYDGSGRVKHLQTPNGVNSTAIDMQLYPVLNPLSDDYKTSTPLRTIGLSQKGAKDLYDQVAFKEDDVTWKTIYKGYELGRSLHKYLSDEEYKTVKPPVSLADFWLRMRKYMDNFMESGHIVKLESVINLTSDFSNLNDNIHKLTTDSNFLIRRMTPDEFPQGVYINNIVGIDVILTDGISFSKNLLIEHGGKKYCFEVRNPYISQSDSTLGFHLKSLGEVTITEQDWITLDSLKSKKSDFKAIRFVIHYYKGSGMEINPPELNLLPEVNFTKRDVYRIKETEFNLEDVRLMFMKRSSTLQDLTKILESNFNYSENHVTGYMTIHHSFNYRTSEYEHVLSYEDLNGFGKIGSTIQHIYGDNFLPESGLLDPYLIVKKNPKYSSGDVTLRVILQSNGTTIYRSPDSIHEYQSHVIKISPQTAISIGDYYVYKFSTMPLCDAFYRKMGVTVDSDFSNDSSFNFKIFIYDHSFMIGYSNGIIGTRIKSLTETTYDFMRYNQTYYMNPNKTQNNQVHKFRDPYELINSSNDSKLILGNLNYTYTGDTITFQKISGDDVGLTTGVNSKVESDPNNLSTEDRVYNYTYKAVQGTLSGNTSTGKLNFKVLKSRYDHVKSNIQLMFNTRTRTSQTQKSVYGSNLSLLTVSPVGNSLNSILEHMLPEKSDMTGLSRSIHGFRMGVDTSSARGIGVYLVSSAETDSDLNRFGSNHLVEPTPDSKTTRILIPVNSHPYSDGYLPINFHSQHVFDWDLAIYYGLSPADGRLNFPTIIELLTEDGLIIKIETELQLYLTSA